VKMPVALRRDFDHVIANPPYYPAGGSPSPIAARAQAMQVDTPLADWVMAATRRLRPGGWLTLICGADGLPEVLGALAPKLGSAAVLPLAPREGRAALRVIVQARKGGRAPFRLLAPLVIHTGKATRRPRTPSCATGPTSVRHSAEFAASFCHRTVTGDDTTRVSWCTSPTNNQGGYP
jgi:tRNA1(Val) A37 N6-methylase TrmN6